MLFIYIRFNDSTYHNLIMKFAILYFSYRKIPGDVCSSENGFHPKTDTVVNLKETCKNGDRTIIGKEEGINLSHPMVCLILYICIVCVCNFSSFNLNH